MNALPTVRSLARVRKSFLWLVDLVKESFRLFSPLKDKSTCYPGKQWLIIKYNSKTQWPLKLVIAGCFSRYGVFKKKHQLEGAITMHTHTLLSLQFCWIRIFRLAWWHTPVVPATQEIKAWNHKFQAGIDSKMRPYLQLSFLACETPCVQSPRNLPCKTNKQKYSGQKHQK